MRQEKNRMPSSAFFQIIEAIFRKAAAIPPFSGTPWTAERSAGLL